LRDRSDWRLRYDRVSALTLSSTVASRMNIQIGRRVWSAAATGGSKTEGLREEVMCIVVRAPAIENAQIFQKKRLRKIQKMPNR
jgi:hypothetical protein